MENIASARGGGGERGEGARASSITYVSRTTFLENGYLSGKDI